MERPIMQIKFLTLYHNFGNTERNLAAAQDDLLYSWRRAIQLNNIKFISEAKVSFKDYSFLEYPDQDKAKKMISDTYGHQNKKQKSIEYYWCGKAYTDLDALYTVLAKQKRFMELTIEVDDKNN